MGARPICCITAKAQYAKNKPLVSEDNQPGEPLSQRQQNSQPHVKTNEANWHSQPSQFYQSSQQEDVQKSLETKDKIKGRLMNSNSQRQLEEYKGASSNRESALPSIQSFRKIEKIKEIIEVNSQRSDRIEEEGAGEQFKLTKQNMDRSIQQWMTGGGASKENTSSYLVAARGAGTSTGRGANQISVSETMQKKVKEASMYCGDSISRINATYKSSAQASLIIGRTARSQLSKKQKGNKNQKISPLNRVPQSSYFGNSQRSLNLNTLQHNKTNNNTSHQSNKHNNNNNNGGNDSKSIDFQITYIQRKQESFYKRGNMTNATNFLKSTNITDVNLQHLQKYNNQNTQFINQKSVIDEERAIISHLMGKDQKMINFLDNSAPHQQQANFLKKRQSQLPDINNTSNRQQYGQKDTVQSPQFNQDDDLMTTKQEQQENKQYPVIGNFDEYEDNSHAVDDNEYLEQFDDEEPHDEETFKEETSPNEACYFDIEPIEANTMVSLNDAQAKATALSYKQHSRFINNMTFDLWEPTIHEKVKFYTEKSGFIDDQMKQNLSKWEVQGKQLKRISEISMNPGLIKEKLQPSKVFAGEQSNEATICAITSVINHDIKFSTDFIGQSLFPQNNGKSILNNYGKYGVKLCVNGEYRIVEVDDFILYNTKKKSVCMSYYEKDQSEFSLSLLEKAYQKVYMGLDYKNCANPSIDMHLLTNWIPETVNFDDVSNKDNLWARLLQNFRDQNIIICLQAQCDELGDTSFYSVLDLIEVDNVKILQCKAAQKGSKRLIKFIHNNDKLPTLFKREQAIAMETGVFYIVWTEDISKYFASISLCWNTKIYPFSQRVHSKLNEKPNLQSHLYNDNYCVYHNPQVLFTIPPHSEDFEVRIMLRRHVKDYFQRNTISFKLFTFDGHRIVYPLEPLRNFQYPTREICSDVFIFENSQEYESYALVLLDEDDNPNQHYGFFTLDVFSFISLEIKELPLPLVDKSYQLQGKWRCEENQILVGGSILSHKFVYNPQYKIQILETTQVQIQVETDGFNSIMLMLYESGKDATEAPFQAVLNNKNQGYFFKGFGYLEVILEPKDYTLVICPESYQQKGGYNIVINKIVSSKYDYNKEIEFEELLIKDYPFYKGIDSKWTLQNSKGTNRILTDEFQAFMKNPGYVIKVREQTVMRCQLVPTDPVIEGHEIASVSICVFEILDNFKFRIILEDDHYAGKAWGYFTEEFQLSPNKHGYLFLCINFDRGAEGTFKFNIMSEVPLKDEIKNFVDVFYKAVTKQYSSNWSVLHNTAGGCSQESTFYKNPQYLIRVQSQTQALFQLESSDQYPVGMVLFEIPKQSENIASLSQIESQFLSQNPKTNSTFLIEVNNLIALLKPNCDYILVCSTYKMGMEGEFILTVSMDNEFKTKALKEELFTSRQTIKGKFDVLNSIEDNPLDQIQRLPHFMFTLPSKCKIRLQLHSNEEIGLRIFLYEIHNNQNGLQLKKSTKDFSCFRFGSLMLLNDLNTDNQGYIIACQPSDHHFAGDYIIEVESSVPLSSLIKDYLLQEQNGNHQMNKQQSSQHIESMQSEKGGKVRKVIKKTSIIRRPE